jgi:tripartite-type tricarboxylate transporter receptor subunit TctC
LYANPEGGPTMKFARRGFLHLAAGAAALPALSRSTGAQNYPTRPVRILVGFPPGGGTDMLARLLAQWLSERLGQQFVVESRPGGSGNLSTEAVVRASADGHTLLLITPANAINATLYDKLNFNFIRDIAAIAGIVRVPHVMLVHPSFPAETIPAFIAYAKANPGKINMASAGNGTPAHLSGELFKIMAGVDMVHVPYRGGAPAMTDLLGGQVQVYFGPTTGSTGYIAAGKLRALGVTGATRLATLPEIPTVGDFLPGFESSQWYGLGAAKNTPVAVVDQLNQEINACLSDPKIRARLADLGGTLLAGSPADFGKLIAEETERWGKVIRAANVRPE